MTATTTVSAPHPVVPHRSSRGLQAGLHDKDLTR
jgi:hypothetical protein